MPATVEGRIRRVNPNGVRALVNIRPLNDTVDIVGSVNVHAESDGTWAAVLPNEVDYRVTYAYAGKVSEFHMFVPPGAGTYWVGDLLEDEPAEEPPPPEEPPPEEPPPEEEPEPPGGIVIETLSALLVGDEQLGTADDSQTINACIARFAAAYADDIPLMLDLEGLTYVCEQSVELLDIGNPFWFGRDGELAPGTIQANTDHGPWSTTDPDEVDEIRNRAHLILKDCADVTIAPRLHIVGPHPDDGPGRSANIPDPRKPGVNIRNYLEQQCGIWVQSCGSFTAVGVDIDHVWGDFISFGTTHGWSTTALTQQATVSPGTWNRNGRVALLAHCNNLLYYGSGGIISRCVSSVYHVEMTSSKPDAGISNHTVQGLEVTGAGEFVNLSGPNFVRNLRFADNHRTDSPVNFQKVVPSSLGRIDGLVIEGNTWDDRGTGGNLLNVWKADGFVYAASNTGPVRGIDRSKIPAYEGPGIVQGCPADRDVDLSGLIVVT